MATAARPWSGGGMRSVHVLGLTLSLLASACALAGQSKTARAQETALETNMNARFGRLEIAVEHVSPKARDTFMEHRRAWGSSIRVADYDMVGLKMTGEDDCETVVRVAWYRAAENDLRATSVKQKWHETKGDWQLTDESRLDGDPGLLGDKVPEPAKDVAAAQAATPRRAFPTVTLGTSNSPTIGGGNIGVMDVPSPPTTRASQLPDPSAEALH